MNLKTFPHLADAISFREALPQRVTAHMYKRGTEWAVTWTDPHDRLDASIREACAMLDRLARTDKDRREMALLCNSLIDAWSKIK